MAKISVLMGIYNTKSKEYLKRSLLSILNQTYDNFELIICNDGSSNDCMKWAHEICKNDSRVLFIENERNMGLAFTLNHCLSVATGEYIARMDDDDESQLDRFEKQILFLEKHKEIGLVSCNINLFNDDGIYGEKKYPYLIKKTDFLFNSPIVHPAIMCRKPCFDEVNGYSESKDCVRVEDYDLFMRMFASGIKMAVIQEFLFNYRNDNATLQRRKKYKYRINEAKVRYYNFKKLGLMPNGFIFVLKPLIVGLIPNVFLKKLKR